MSMSAPKMHPNRLYKRNTPFSSIRENSVFAWYSIGGAYGIRTRDPHTASVVRSQLR